MNTLVEPPFDVVAALQHMVSPDDIRRWGVINATEAALITLEQMEQYEVEHYAFPGFIARQVLLRAPSIITTERHKQWHPYVISWGEVSVYDELTGQVQHIKALPIPGGHFTSITEPGTRRLIFVREDTLWTTFHPCTHNNPEQLVKEAIFENDNPLLL